MPKRMEFPNEDGAGRGAACADWGALLPDAAEDLLSEAESWALAQHIAGCSACEGELAEARRGAAWLSLLSGDTPEPPLDLVTGILARTTGSRTLAETVAVDLPAAPVSAWPGPVRQPTPTPFRAETPANGRWWARWFGFDSNPAPILQPRLTMTAAMAFFSVCITLNMLGISVTHLHAQNLHTLKLPQTMAGKGASVLRSFQGLRAVYRVESRMNGWLAASAAPDAAAASRQ